MVVIDSTKIPLNYRTTMPFLWTFSTLLRAVVLRLKLWWNDGFLELICCASTFYYKPPCFLGYYSEWQRGSKWQNNLLTLTRGHEERKKDRLRWLLIKRIMLYCTVWLRRVQKLHADREWECRCRRYFQIPSNNNKVRNTNYPCVCYNITVGRSWFWGRDGFFGTCSEGS